MQTYMLHVFFVVYMACMVVLYMLFYIKILKQQVGDARTWTVLQILG